MNYHGFSETEDLNISSINHYSRISFVEFADLKMQFSYM